MSDISPAKLQHSLVLGNAFNADKALNLKGFRASADGAVTWNDEDGVQHTEEFLKGETPAISGAFSIEATTAINLLIYL